MTKEEIIERLESVTEFADRCKECGAKCGKLLKPKTGSWIIVNRDGVNKYVCSECDNEPLLIGESYPIFKLSDYCPYCGAKMEDENV